MLHKALTPENGRTPPPLVPLYNQAASDVSEIELKMLVKPLPDGNVDKSAFANIKEYFENLGWIRSSSEVLRISGDEEIPNGERGALLTRQLDTPDMALYKKGVTLRVRGDCRNGDMKNVTSADICVKFGNTQSESGALHRKEYEVKIDSFNRVDLAPLRKKYSKKDHPELHEALKGIRNNHLVEFYRPDVLRNRHLVEIPEEVTGVKGKKFFIELLLDEVSFVFDPKPQRSANDNGSIPQHQGPIVYHVDLEVEAEAMFKVCAYDPNPESSKYVSSPMTDDEVQQAMAAVHVHIKNAARGQLSLNKYSKAERGFQHFENMMANLKDYVQLNANYVKDGSIQPAFALKANPNACAERMQKLHHLLSKDFGPYLRERSRPIARHP